MARRKSLPAAEPANGNGHGGTATAEPPLPALEIATRRVPLHAILPSPFQKRRPFDQKKLEELAAAYRRGDPIARGLARPRAGNIVELVYGHRRLAAAELAGLTELELNVAEMTDSQARHFAWEENAGREDLHPLDEADLFADWSETESLEEIAARVGRPPSFVRSRIKLSRLAARGRAALLDGRLGIGQALLIAGLDSEEDQEEALVMAVPVETFRHRATVRELGEWLEKRTQDLGRAPWPLEDATYPGGACTVCPKRTGATAELFAGAGVGDRCLDSECFAEKITAHAARGAEVLRLAKGEKAKRGTLPKSAYVEINEPTPGQLAEIKQELEDEAREAAEEARGAGETVEPIEITDEDVREEIKNGYRDVDLPCEHAKPAIGPKGGMVKVCINEDCKVHGADIRAQKARVAAEAKCAAKETKKPQEKPQESYEERRKREQAERDLEDAIAAKTLDQVLAKLPLQQGRLRRRDLNVVAVGLLEQSYAARQRAGFKSWNTPAKTLADFVGKKKDQELQRYLLELVLVDSEDELAAYAKELKVNVKAIEAEVKLAQEAASKPTEKPTKATKKKGKAKR